MRAREIVGRRIARVDQQRVSTNTGPKEHLVGIALDDGSVLSFDVAEMPTLEYAVLLRRAPSKGGKPEAVSTEEDVRAVFRPLSEENHRLVEETMGLRDQNNRLIKEHLAAVQERDDLNVEVGNLRMANLTLIRSLEGRDAEIARLRAALEAKDQAP